MSTAAAGAGPADQGSDVLVAQVVVDKMRELDPGAAAAVARAILRIPDAAGAPIPLNVPGDPPGTVYRALSPDADGAPVVIYREALPGEDGRWRVTTLMDPAAYRAYSNGLADDPVVQGVATIVAEGTVTASEHASRQR
ncbi:MAG TPA: hypothetical protein VKD66_01665 [Streptosporangiaceae bacterium]|nr:hypothetical protein [Streptosporangiaceae bacterium]